VKRIELIDLAGEARDLVRECEAQGARTLFQRNGRPVAMLVSYDEYMALSETLAIANDSLLFARLEEAEEQVRNQKMLLIEDLV
jgi:prevent-host-death family protein